MAESQGSSLNQPRSKPRPGSLRLLSHNSNHTLNRDGASSVTSITGEEAHARDLKVYNALADPKTQKVSAASFKLALRRTGIALGDTRVADDLAQLRDYLTFRQLADLLRKNDTIESALSGHLVVPDFESLVCDFEEYFYLAKDLKSDLAGNGGRGLNASYIPQLAKVNPDQHAVAVCTIDGQTWAIGDAEVPFCVQSCTKPIQYCMAVNLLGTEKVHEHVGREPSGRNFNCLTLQAPNDAGKELPHNPMVNSGAIMCASLINPSVDQASRFDYVMGVWRELTGGYEPGFANSTYLSERATADQNKCLAYMMKEKGVFPDGVDIMKTLDFYFMNCSIEVTCRALSVVAATLANGGVCPTTGVRVFSPLTVRNCLSLMSCCGMYDYSGEFQFSVGVPCKSGVAGALMIVIPDVMGVATWSPRLDKLGNSVFGVNFCNLMGKGYAFHTFAAVSEDTLAKKHPKRIPETDASEDATSLIYAASEGDLGHVRHMVARGVDPRIVDYDGRSPLHLAASEGHIHVVKYLVGCGVDLGARDRFGGTPLDDAQRERRSAVVAFLNDLAGSQPHHPADAAADAAADRDAPTPPNPGALSRSPSHGDDGPASSDKDKSTHSLSDGDELPSVSQHANAHLEKLFAYLMAMSPDGNAMNITASTVSTTLQESGIIPSDPRFKAIFKVLAQANPDLRLKVEMSTTRALPIVTPAFSSTASPPSARIRSPAGRRRSSLDSDGIDVAALLNIDSAHITPEQMQEIVGDFPIFRKVIEGRLVVPDFSAFTADVDRIYDLTAPNQKGDVAQYIPQLAAVNPDQFGVAVCTVDGQQYAKGDSDVKFCVQSCSKPISYCIAVEELGLDEVHRHVGREPSGQNFNEITLDGKSRPHNPLINAGAIMTCSLVRGDADAAEKFDVVSDVWKRLSGGAPPGFSNSTYLSELDTADRNFCLAYLMKEKGAFPRRVDSAAALRSVLEFYFQCCSIEVTCKTMSVVAATLANGGVCPTTGERVFKSETVRDCLSLMQTCGMYDYSGEFQFTVGFPCKSGVAGALMIVIPNVMGICTFSPRLDKLGNSSRGIEFCARLGQEYSLHCYDTLRGVTSARAYDNSAASSVKKDVRMHKGSDKEALVSKLLYAASQGDLPTIRQLQGRGVDLLAADYDGRTALHLAAAEGKSSVVKFFISLKVNLTPLDRWGASPLSDAEACGHEKIAAILRKHGARMKRPQGSDLGGICEEEEEEGPEEGTGDDTDAS